MPKKSSFKYIFLLAVSVGLLPNSLAHASTSAAIQQKISTLFSNTNEDELLEPEKAFKSRISATGAGLLVDLVPAKGYYLYKDKIRFALKDAKGVIIGAINLPKGEIKMDATFGKMEVYRYPVQVNIALERMATTRTITVVTSYQGCHEKTGVCYPPVVTSEKVLLPKK